MLLLGLVGASVSAGSLPLLRAQQYLIILGVAVLWGQVAVWWQARTGTAAAERVQASRPGHAVTFGLLATVIAVLYGPALRFELLADDYFVLVYTLGFGAERWLPQAGWHHYFPLGLELMALPQRLAGWNPAWFHAHSWVALLGTAWAVMKLAEQAGVAPRFSLIAALLWLTFPLQASAGFWAAVINYTYCTLFAILAVLAYRRAVRTGSWWGYAAACMAIAASMLCIEQGAAAAVLCWLAAWQDRGTLRERGRGTIAAAVILPGAPVVALLLWKAALGGAATYPGLGPGTVLRTASAFGWSLLTPGWSTGLQAGLVFANRGTLVLCASLAVMAALYILIARPGGPARRFGIGWALVAGLPAVIGAPGVVSRYYVLPGVGVAVALAAWLSEAKSDEQRAWRLGALGVFMFAGAVWIGQWRGDFARASAMTAQFRSDVGTLLAPDVLYDRIALVDLPSHVGDGDWPVPLFATGPRVMIGLLRGDLDLEAVRAVRVWRTTEETWTQSEAVFVDAETVTAAAADPSQVILRWNGGAGRLERLGGPAP